MTPVELAAERLLEDLRAIINRDGSVLQRFQAVEDRVMAAEREMEAARKGVHEALLHHLHTCEICGAGPLCQGAHAINRLWRLAPPAVVCDCGETDCQRLPVHGGGRAA